MSVFCRGRNFLASTPPTTHRPVAPTSDGVGLHQVAADVIGQDRTCCVARRRKDSVGHHPRTFPRAESTSRASTSQFCRNILTTFSTLWCFQGRNQMSMYEGILQERHSIPPTPTASRIIRKTGPVRRRLACEFWPRTPRPEH